jgi:hypothetical protein
MLIKINNEKAIEVTKEKIRAWREVEFAKNDISIQNALVDGNETARLEAVGYRDYLRDLPAQCYGKSLDELKTILEGLA